MWFAPGLTMTSPWVAQQFLGRLGARRMSYVVLWRATSEIDMASCLVPYIPWMLVFLSHAFLWQQTEPILLKLWDAAWCECILKLQKYNIFNIVFVKYPWCERKDLTDMWIVIEDKDNNNWKYIKIIFFYVWIFFRRKKIHPIATLFTIPLVDIHCVAFLLKNNTIIFS